MATGPIEAFMAKEFGKFNFTAYKQLNDEQKLWQKVIRNLFSLPFLWFKLAGKSSSKGRKIVTMLKSLVEPMSYDFTLSDEDRALAATIDAAEALEKRDNMINKAGEAAGQVIEKMQSVAVPAWNKMRSKVRNY
ncbi:unnamed protein product [Gongylonema pulchrum]|uniref:Uncharacterized protein n=1 Tax=Gongylonema pulchrum TaxID=637853 RepID=A0A183F186_9BILA|nr:unnamed protein product [Gongylonema pulchrum]